MKEQLKKLGGSRLIPEGLGKPDVVHLVTKGGTGQLGLYRFETQMTPGNGKHSTSGLGSNTPAKEAVRIGFDYFKGNLNRHQCLGQVLRT